MSAAVGNQQTTRQTGRTAANHYALAAVLFALVALALVKVGRASFISQDDAFFLDAARNLLDHGKLSLSIWGNALGHEDFLASYPPLVPAVAATDLWLVRITGDPLLIKTSGIVLMLVSAAVFWTCLSFVKTPWMRSLTVFAAFVDPLPMTYFFTLRPESLLMLAMLLLYVSAVRLMGGWSLRAFVTITLTSLAAALAHWQFLPLLVLMAATLAWLAIRRRAPLWSFAVYSGAVTATYAVYAYIIMAAPVRAAAFREQMGHVAGSSSLATKVKFLGGNLLAANIEMGSAYSICTIWVLLLLAWRMAGWMEGRDADERETDAFAFGFLVVGIAPSLYLDYVGPRMVPLYLVVLLLLFSHARSVRPIWLLSLTAVLATAINYIGAVGLEYSYYRARGTGPLTGPPLAWLALAILVFLLSRRVGALKLTAFALSGASVVSLALFGRAQRNQGFHMTRGNQIALAHYLGNRGLEGKSVLGDLSVHYLPLEEAVPTARMYSIFPILYFNTPMFFQEFMTSVKPAVVLLTPSMNESMAESPPNGTALLDTLRTAFVVRDSFAVTGVKTWVLERR